MKSILPGDRLSDEEIPAAKCRQDRIMNPKGLRPIEAFHEWSRLGIETLTEELLQEGSEYLLLYEHPVHRYKDRLHRVRGAELRAFLKDRVVPDRMEGIDVTILPFDDEWGVICNHDGDIFFRRRQGEA